MEHSFYGTSELNVDDKGRIIIPTRYADALEDGMFLTYGSEKCIWVLTAGKWRDVQERAQGLNLSRHFKRLLFAGEPARLDTQRRVMLPAELRKHAGVLDENGLPTTGSVILSGAEERLEIWHPKLWHAATTRASEEPGHFDAYDDILAQLGL